MLNRIQQIVANRIIDLVFKGAATSISPFQVNSVLKSKTYCLYPYVTCTSQISSGSTNHKTFWEIFVAIAWKIEKVGLSFSRFNRCAQPYHPGSGSRMRECLETEGHIFGGEEGGLWPDWKKCFKTSYIAVLIKIFFEFDRLFLRFKQEGGLYSGGGGGYNRMYFFVFR